MTLPTKANIEPLPKKGKLGTYFFKYISERGVVNLPRYQYAGADASLLYQKLLSPFLNWLVAEGYVPDWLHPNVITLTGLSFMLASHIATAMYCPTFSESAPWWVFAFNGVAMFIYWVLDALDGKQARKTGTSSPLGLLMDHGCDAVNVTIGLLNVASMLRLGAGMETFAIWAFAAAVFFTATWEEYYVGSLNLPAFNGPNEGVVIGICLQFWTAYIGNEWWLGTSSFGCQRNHVFVGILCTTAISTILLNIYNVVTTVFHMKKDQHKYTSSQREAGTHWVALSRTIPLIMMIGMAFGWASLSPTDVFARHPRVFLWICGLLLCKLVMTMMVAHLCDESYHPFGKTFAGFLALATHGALVYKMVGMNDKWEDLVLFEFGGVMLISYIHMVTFLAWEVSTLLDISIFFIPSKTA